MENDLKLIEKLLKSMSYDFSKLENEIKLGKTEFLENRLRTMKLANESLRNILLDFQHNLNK